MSEAIQVQMLGEFTIRYGDCVISDSNDRSHRVWSLLAYLLVNRRREFTQEELINLCWSGGTGSSDPANALKSVFHRIRALLDRLEDGLGHRLLLRRSGRYVWNEEVPITLDIEQFEERCRRGDREKEPEARLRAYQAAVGCYRGDLLPRLSGEIWVMPLETYYHGLYAGAVSSAIEILEDCGRTEELAALCRQAVKIEPYKEEFYEHLSGDHDVSTSQPSPETILNLWEKLLEEYDAVVHIPMSSGLSSSCQTAKMLADDFDGKVQVADNHRISVTQRRSVQDALDMAAAGMDAEAICKKLEDTGLDSTIYVTVDTLKYLKKGGRITPAAAALGTLLRLKPVLTIQGEKLDAFAKARTMKQARSMMITAITRDLETRFGDVTGEKTYIDVAHTDNDEMAQELAAELRELFSETEVHVDPLSLSVACHIGPGALAIAASKKLEIGSLL